MVERQLAARGITDARVLAAMRSVPRHLFCNPPGHAEAYRDHPLPIGEDQTISQPYMVAVMTQLLRLTGSERVLEIGTGSGYQTAILAELAAEVYSVERIAVLAERARETLASQGYANVRVEVGDGTLGWPEHAPYDRIICGAAGPDVPEAWIDQLVDGGRIVMPVGRSEGQMLVTVEKTDRRVTRREFCAVRFVRLIGRNGWPDDD